MSHAAGVKHKRRARAALNAQQQQQQGSKDSAGGQPQQQPQQQQPQQEEAQKQQDPAPAQVRAPVGFLLLTSPAVPPTQPHERHLPWRAGAGGRGGA